MGGLRLLLLSVNPSIAYKQSENGSKGIFTVFVLRILSSLKEKDDDIMSRRRG